MTKKFSKDIDKVFAGYTEYHKGQLSALMSITDLIDMREKGDTFSLKVLDYIQQEATRIVSEETGQKVQISRSGGCWEYVQT